MWFSSYLQNRKQFVMIGGHNSDIHQVEYSVLLGGMHFYMQMIQQ